jgi:SAM-dependent methyltransferase
MGKEMQPELEHSRTYYAEAFKDLQVVDAYRYRPPYPQEVFNILANLIVDEPRAVLDVGAGSGDIARHIVDLAERVDAVDFSQNMIKHGKHLPNGDDPHLHWVYGKVEEVPLAPPYALITAGSSIHWMDWPRAFPRFRSMLTSNGTLALLSRRILSMPWDSELRKLHGQARAHQSRRSAHALAELEALGFFRRQGVKETAPVPFTQSLDDFIEGLHSRSRFSRVRMGQEEASDFDRQVRTLLLRHHPDGMLPLRIVGVVTWGIPEIGSTI